VSGWARSALVRLAAASALAVAVARVRSVHAEAGGARDRASADSRRVGASHAVGDSVAPASRAPLGDSTTAVGGAADSVRSSRAVPFEGAPIRRVAIQPRRIFDPVPPGRLAGFYRTANALHVRTRPRTIRQLLLFGPGDPWSADRAAENMRRLRSLDFLTPVAITPAWAGDSVDVEVVTRDTWTTSPEFNIESSSGVHKGTVAFTERNFFGLGKSVSLAYRDEPAGISRTLSADDPAVFGSRLGIGVEAGTGSAGVTNGLVVGVPFYAEDTPHSYGVAWGRATSVTRLYSGGEEAAQFDERVESTELMWGRGRRQEGTIVRGIGSFLIKDRRMGPSRLEPGAPPDFDGVEDNLKLRRVAGELRLWRPHFVEKTGVERMTGIEDFDLGPTAAIKLGVSPRFLGGTADEAYGRFEVDAGAQTPFGFGWVRSSAESRWRWTPIEIVRRLDARWIVQGPLSHTFVLAAHGVQGERVPRDFQVATGGLNGLRAYPVHELSGRRLWRFNAEDRWILGREYWDLITVGAAAFYDGARAWGPGAGGTDWHHDVGAGLRFALPHSSLNQVVRLDVALPIAPTRDGRREPVLSFGSSQAF